MYYCILDIETGGIRYLGRRLEAAAQKMVARTVSGQGETREDARKDAERCLEKCTVNQGD